MKDWRSRIAAATAAAIRRDPRHRRASRRQARRSSGSVGLRACALSRSCCRSSRMCSIRSWCSTLSSNWKRSSGTRRSRIAAPICRRRNGVARSSARLRLALRLVVAHERVEDARQLQVGRDLHARQRDETDAGIVHLAREQLAQLLADFFADAVGTRSLSHDQRKVLHLAAASRARVRAARSRRATDRQRLLAPSRPTTRP